MTGDGKLLKIICLATLFVGLGSLAYGIALAVHSVMDYDAWATAGEGLLSTVYGVRSAILANVPSNTAKIRTKALVLLAVGVAVAGFFAYAIAGVTMPQIALAIVIVLLALGAVAMASKIVKDQFRK